MADLIGDIDPVKAANKRLSFGDPEVIHYGVIPRTNRGIFAINEVPDLAPRIQVGLLNILEEGDVQIRGFPIRIPLDILMVFSANPEDYTNRGNLITPLKDRIESQIKTHYPRTLEEAMAITAQEAYVERDGVTVAVPPVLRELVEEMGIEARKSEYVDQSSGVSARVTISALENLVSNAERRAHKTGETRVVPRFADLGNVLPALTGKIELVYEGELEGTSNVARHIIGKAVKSVFTRRFPEAKRMDADRDRDDTPFQSIIDWFSSGKTLELTDELPEETYRASLKVVSGLADLARRLEPNDDEELATSMELVLEGLVQYSMIAREDLDTGHASYRDVLGEMMEQLEEER
jgi:magnesium chelatase subunit I